MSENTKKHEDTKISLHPLSFDQAIEKLANPLKVSQPKETKLGNTSKADLESDRTKPQTSQNQ